MPFLEAILFCLERLTGEDLDVWRGGMIHKQKEKRRDDKTPMCFCV